MGWGVHGMGRTWSVPDMGEAGLRLGPPWFGPYKGWAAHSFGRPWAGEAMVWTGAWAGQIMERDRHGLGWP
jgi:hypothetical protein